MDIFSKRRSAGMACVVSVVVLVARTQCFSLALAPPKPQKGFNHPRLGYSKTFMIHSETTSRDFYYKTTRNDELVQRMELI